MRGESWKIMDPPNMSDQQSPMYGSLAMHIHRQCCNNYYCGIYGHDHCETIDFWKYHVNFAVNTNFKYISSQYSILPCGTQWTLPPSHPIGTILGSGFPSDYIWFSKSKYFCFYFMRGMRGLFIYLWYSLPINI